ncbi:MAG: ATP-binding protein [Alphaproteobacteria bacterium]|nr:ATP-binding protein [Alphaproteobacteria bacterium]
MKQPQDHLMSASPGDPSTAQAQRLDVTAAERSFTDKIYANRATGEVAEATLRTDDRVLARITDGIYRQPSSALRELISNAYDADARNVYIETDAPRFSQIRIRDSGGGMTEEVLSRMIHHIGGSSKRTTVGAALGTTDPADPSRSPKGRKLIGKIGIGLFSVSQLTSHFQIITKIRGQNYRLFADVILRTYNDEGAEPADGTYKTGSVRVVSVPAEDVESHGTEVILLGIRPQARDILRSRERWERLAEQEERTESERDPNIAPPSWHAGFLAPESSPADGDYLFKTDPKLPWSRNDDPRERFRKLYQAVADQVGSTAERPDLAKTLDTYLATLWTLSLSAPVGYMGKHPFDLGAEDNILAFKLSGAGRGRAEQIALGPGRTVREAAGLSAGSPDPVGGFSVFVDQVELRRPISYQYWPAKKQAIGRPMLFVGSYRPDLSSVREDMRGGDLEFEGYLFWNSRIVPKENNGVLVRINGASGALFDDTFMKYPISEQTRLRQITAEIFVGCGVDAALNIDRESFNFAHPHYQLLSKWVHRNLRQLANTHKAISEDIRAREQSEARAVAASKLEKFAARSWAEARRSEFELPPEVEVVTTPFDAAARRREGVIAFDKTLINAATAPPGKGSREDTERRDRMIKAIATVLDGFGVLEGMPYPEQHRLLNALLAIYFEDAQE